MILTLNVECWPDPTVTPMCNHNGKLLSIADPEPRKYRFGWKKRGEDNILDTNLLGNVAELRHLGNPEFAFESIVKICSSFREELKR